MLEKIKKFVAPPRFPEDDEKTRIATLLNTLLWLFISVFVVLTVVSLFLDNATEAIVSYVLVVAANFLPLTLLKRGQVKAASWVTIVMFYLAIVGSGFYLSGLSLSILSSFLVMIVATGLLLGRTQANVLAGITIVISAILAHLEAIGQIVSSATSLSDILAVGANIVVLAITLTLTLRDLTNFSNRMRQSNEDLLAVRDSLEQTVAERTRALALAADIGRSVSQIRQLDELLQDAVNTIQERFGLYYAQIYLTDRRQKTLSLQAGTGIVGRQLVRRGHVLTIGTGSINGTAVTEKRTVVVPDTAASPMFKPNSLLPFTRSEMSVPLMLGDEVLGVLNLQSDVVRGLTAQNADAFETLAGQLAVAIENANLFTETQEARAQVEEYVGVVVREGWDNYQDGITQPELLGFSFEEDTLQRLIQPTPATAMGGSHLNIPIVIASETIGTIQLEAEPGHVWTEEEKEMVTAVARQVGQQAENLRLLAETYQYRNEAEQFARRLSGEAWRDFVEDRGESGRGFMYDQNEIQPLSSEAIAALPESDVLWQPLQVQSEVIGEMIIAGAGKVDDGLLAAVSEQLSAHIENLRLARQTETALAQTDVLYHIGHDLNTAANVEEVLLAALRPVMATGVSEATLMFVELDKKNEPEALELLADWQHEGRPSYPVGIRFPVKQFPFAGLFLRDPSSPQLLGDVLVDERVDEFTRNVMTQAGIRAIAVVPLTVAQQWVGIMTCSWSTVHPFTRQEREIFNALINMTAPTVQSQRLFAKTKSQADKERIINIINQRIQGTVTVESALQTAVKELGQALQTTAQVKLTTAATRQDNHQPEAVAAD
ncbi:MAG: GAF domain-containing protein [Anaerolineales bacterium]|nr:GAF domain-containing protein [Anaerolineales bacterium]